MAGGQSSTQSLLPGVIFIFYFFVQSVIQQMVVGQLAPRSDFLTLHRQPCSIPTKHSVVYIHFKVM